MKNVLVLACLIFSITAGAQEFPKPSLLAKTYQVVGLTEVEIEYSSPGVKGRTIFGDVVPFNALWRTGANMATVITFSTPTKFGETRIPEGSYSLFSTPTENTIQFYLNSNTDQGGTGSYDATLNVAVISVDFEKTKNVVERLNFSFENTTNDGTSLRMTWADRTCLIPLSVDTEVQAMTNFKEKLEEYRNGEYQLYHQAATYFLEKGDAAQAVQNGSKSVKLMRKFWNTHTLALAYRANGENEKALETAKMSLELSEQAEYAAYIKKNMELIAELEK